MADPDIVRIELSLAEAIALDNKLSDLLCWATGFAAARAGTDLDGEVPMGVEAVRSLRIMLNKQIPSR